ncbi:hypothetical protein CLAIMM_04211 [Cladophialophora immunda]|nr:hypothetical protein CLAIMM_04211 [Cladophialophora immunda]
MSRVHSPCAFQMFERAFDMPPGVRLVSRERRSNIPSVHVPAELGRSNPSKCTSWMPAHLHLYHFYSCISSTADLRVKMKWRRWNNERLGDGTDAMPPRCFATPG